MMCPDAPERLGTGGQASSVVAPVRNQAGMTMAQNVKQIPSHQQQEHWHRSLFDPNFILVRIEGFDFEV